MDPLILREKLESLRRCIDRVYHRRPTTVAQLEADADLQDILALRRAVGFRNVAVRNYSAINWAMVHAISESHLDDFRRFAQEISARFLDAREH